MLSSNKGKQGLEEEKRLLRQEVKNKIGKLSCDQLRREEHIIESKLQALPVYRDSRVIMFYWSLPGEVDTKNLISKAKEKKKTVALPVIADKNDMQPYEFSCSSELLEGPLKIMQPDVNISSPVEAGALDIVIVPGVAFDREGRRLGRGKGYYDRFLSRISGKTCKIGLAFNCQFLTRLPFDSLRDEKVDLVITG